MASLGYDFELTVSAPANAVRKALVGAIRDFGFQVTVEQLTLVEARRGSKMASLWVTHPKRLPIDASFTLQAAGTATRVAGHLADGWGKGAALGTTVGANWAFEEVFREAYARISEALARLDPASARPWDPAGFWSALGTIGPMEKIRSFGGRMSGTAIDKVSGTLEGGHDPTPEAWRQVERMAFSFGGQEASLSLPEVQAHLAVGMLVEAQPGSMPANLVRDVEAFVVRAEGALNSATGEVVQLDLTASEKPVLEFLHQQVLIRDGLPVRTLHVCETCRLEKITNPDYARIVQRNNRLRSLVGVGATVTGGSIQPFVMVGSLLKLAKLDPDYVCSRCQGMNATEGVVTFCPSCGELRKEAVLRICPKCKHDFRTAVGSPEFWGAPRPVVPPPTPAPSPTLAPTPAAAPVVEPPVLPVEPPVLPVEPPVLPVEPPVLPVEAAPPASADLPTLPAVPPAPVPPPPDAFPAPPLPAPAVAMPAAAAPTAPAMPTATTASAPVPPPTPQLPPTPTPTPTPQAPPAVAPAFAGPSPATATPPPGQPPAGFAPPPAMPGAPAPSLPPPVAQPPTAAASWPPPPKRSGPASAAWPPPPRSGAQPAPSWGAPPAYGPPASGASSPRMPAHGSGFPPPGAPAPGATGHGASAPATPGPVAPAPRHQARTYQIGPGGGKLCESCGREFAALWRIVVSTPIGTEDRFVCGLPPACSIPSLVAPLRV